MRFADLSQDVRYVARGVRTAPGFFLTLTFTLALGIALTTVLVSVVDAVLLRGLPFANADRLVTLQTKEQNFTLPGVRMRAADVWRAQGAIFERVELYGETQLEYTRGAEPAMLRGTDVSAGVFEMLGVPAQLGRTFAADDFAANATPTVVIADDFWRTRLRHDPQILGKTITLNGVARTVIGVMPPGFTFHTMAPKAWIPMDQSAARRGDGLIRVLALRHAPLAVAQALADARAEQLAREEPGTDLTWKIALVPVGSWRANPDVSRALWVVLAAAGCVLLIGCANAANLVLVRNVTRERELALRSALGAARSRLARQLLVENLAIAAASGALGIACAHGLLAAVVPLIPSEVTFGSYFPITLDARVLAFASLVTLGTGLVFGMAPALLASSRGERLSSAIIGRTATDTAPATRLRAATLAVQLAFAAILVSGALLFARSFARLLNVPPGLDVERLAIMSMNLGQQRYPDSTARRAFYDGLTERLRALPGVVAISRAMGAPPRTGFSFDITAEAEGRAVPASQPDIMPFNIVDSAYFATTGTALLAGRGFQRSDEGSDVAVVSAGLAQWLWGDESPVGRRFRLDTDRPWTTVIGVAADAKLMGPDDREGRFGLYRYREGMSAPYVTIVLRTNGDPAALLDGMRRAVHAIDPDQPAEEVTTMTEQFGNAVAKPRFFLVLMTLFGASALVLASVGIYGTASFAANRRSRELAIRMALGATDASVKRLVMRQTILIVAAGLLAGGATAVLLSRFVGSLLFGVEALDPVSLGGAGGVLFVAALCASYVPVATVLRRDPLASLRAE